MGLFDGQPFSMERAADNVMSPLGLAAQNLARFDSGGIDMGAAAGRAQMYHQDKANQTNTRKYLEMNRPDLLPLLDSGASPTELLSQAFGQAQEEKKQAAEQQRLQQLARFITDPQLSAMVASGAMPFPEAYKHQTSGGEPFTLGEGQIRYDAAGNVIAQGAPESPSVPAGYMPAPDGNGLAYIPGGPADPSTQAKTTEAQRRNQQLASVIAPELQNVEANWEELASGGNQAGNMVPGLGNALTSPGYQQASNSLKVIAQSYLYSVSGAAATDAEVQKIVDSVTPRPFENPDSIADKKRRIQQMADAVIQAGGGSSSVATPSTGQTSTGLTWSIEP